MYLHEIAEIYVPDRKITHYLLSETHPSGKEKAAFFSSFGFTIEEWDDLAEAIRSHVFLHEIADSQLRVEGKVYVVEGKIQTPDRRNPSVRTVWIVEIDSSIARFVTAYPL
jgi:hypothetical protein